MALVSCPECRQQVSDQAVVCPHCGFPLQKPGDPAETAHRDAIKALLSSDGKIAAIRLARELRHLGLKEAKDYVESIEAEFPKISRTRSKGCLGTGALAVLIGVALVAMAVILWALLSVL